jgi:hypothetical protein
VERGAPHQVKKSFNAKIAKALRRQANQIDLYQRFTVVRG